MDSRGSVSLCFSATDVSQVQDGAARKIVFCTGFETAESPLIAKIARSDLSEGHPHYQLSLRPERFFHNSFAGIGLAEFSLGPSMLLVPFSACAYLGSYFRAAWTTDWKPKKLAAA
jgi:hypothetical protein